MAKWREEALPVGGGQEPVRKAPHVVIAGQGALGRTACGRVARAVGSNRPSLANCYSDETGDEIVTSAGVNGTGRRFKSFHSDQPF